MNLVGNNLKEVTGDSNIPSSNTNNPSKKSTTNINNDNVSDKGDTTVSWEGSNYTINKKGQIFDANGNLIQAKDNTTSKIVNGVKVTNYLNSLSAEELAERSFTGKELFPGSMFSVNNYIELPSGQVWNGNIVVSKEWNGVGEEIDRVKRERAQKSSRTTSQDLQAQAEIKRQDAINNIKEASPSELEGGNVSPFSTNYGNKYIAGISREDVELKVNSAHALELEELGFGPPPTSGMTITEEVPLFGALETKKADIERKTKEELFPIDSLHKGKESGDTLKVIGYTKDGVRFQIQTEGTLKPTKNVILSELKRLIKEGKLTSDVYAEIDALEDQENTTEISLVPKNIPVPTYNRSGRFLDSKLGKVFRRESENSFAPFELINISNNGDRAEIISSVQGQVVLIGNVSAFTDNVAEIRGNPENAKFATTVKPAKVHKRDGVWEVVEKGIILFSESQPTSVRNPEYVEPATSSTRAASQEAPVRRIPKSKKTKTVLDIGTANVTKSEIESKIQENKDHHKDNCNGIIPF